MGTIGFVLFPLFVQLESEEPRSGQAGQPTLNPIGSGIRNNENYFQAYSMLILKIFFS